MEIVVLVILSVLFMWNESVSLDRTSAELTIGTSLTLSATVLPENAAEKQVIWSTNDETVATVSPEGCVVGVGVGSATITVTTCDGWKTANCYVTVKKESSIEAVDLGLPSGLKWASCNLGAAKPEEYGNHYAWGETEPYYSSLSPLIWKDGKSSGYSWASYKWCKGTEHTLTKYCFDSSYGYNGFIDNKNSLDLEADVAHVTLGGSWRIPTKDNLDELRTQCTWTWTTMNGVKGMEVVGPNGNSIFLPANGGYPRPDLSEPGVRDYYWSTSLSYRPDCGMSFIIYQEGTKWYSLYGRCSGQAIRPVCP